MDRLDSGSSETRKGSPPPFFAPQVICTPDQDVNVPAASDPPELLSYNPTNRARCNHANFNVERKHYWIVEQRTAKALS